MRPSLYLLLLGASLTSARNVLDLSEHKNKISQQLVPAPQGPQQIQARSQSPMTQPSTDRPDSSEPAGASDGNSDLTISDILPTARQINIFASLTRDVSSLNSRLEGSIGSSNTTLLAPLNSAMSNLPRKPWEDRPNDNSGVSAASNEDKAAKNLKQFVLEHAVGVSPWTEGEKVKTLWAEETGGNGEIWWERRGGGSDGQEAKKVIMPGEIVVDKVVGRVGNGEIWALKGALNYKE